MSTKTKKILAVACWVMVILAWSILTANNVIDDDTVLARITHVLIVGVGGVLGCWIMGIFNLKDKE